MKSFVKFFLASLKNPLQTSTIFETGPNVTGRFARRVDLLEDEYLVELGVGAGAVTDALLSKITDRKQYIGIELNQELYGFLKEKYPDLEIHNDSAENLQKYVQGRKVGMVVATLPWSLLRKETREETLKQVHSILRPGGLFGTFISYHVRWSHSASHVVELLLGLFGDLENEDEFLNFPPCRLYFVRK